MVHSSVFEQFFDNFIEKGSDINIIPCLAYRRSIKICSGKWGFI